MNERRQLLLGGVTFFLYFQLFDIAALRFVSLRTKGKAAMLSGVRRWLQRPDLPGLAGHGLDRLGPVSDSGHARLLGSSVPGCSAGGLRCVAPAQPNDRLMENPAGGASGILSCLT